MAPSALRFARPDDPVIVVNSFSKTWAMTGWRLGWMVMPMGLAPVVERLLEFNTSGGQPFLQRAASRRSNDGEDFVAEQLARFRAGRDLVTQRLGGMRRVRVTALGSLVLSDVPGRGRAGFPYARPQAGGRGAASAWRPGAAFGAGGEGFLRLCFAASTPRLGEAMDRLEPFLS